MTSSTESIKENSTEKKRIQIEKLNTDNPREFWNSLGNLGPQPKSGIPMEVYDGEGNVTGEKKIVIDTWKHEFQGLFQGYDANDFDDIFYEDILNAREQLEKESLNENDHDMNVDITLSEVEKVLGRAKYNKAVGVDSLPNEVFKNHFSCELLHILFNKIFKHHIIPSLWKRSIIKPIPKNSTIDPRLPMQYRGIALLSNVYKLYTAILNNRIVYHLETNNIYAEEQNGFRQNRSCSEHIFSLLTILKNRKCQNKSTFLAFLDAEKAFDRVDRNLLLYKVLTNGIRGHMYENIKNIYGDSFCSVNINNMLTDWFDTKCGVKQGDTLSPTMFNIFINDIVRDVKSLDSGVEINGIKICILLYADDIVLISDCEEDLQKMLDKVYDWSRKWRVKFNIKKSNILHVRQPHVA